MKKKHGGKKKGERVVAVTIVPMNAERGASVTRADAMAPSGESRSVSCYGAKKGK